MNHPIQEGYMPYLGYQTYYRIVGEPSNKPALLCLHGGPGSTHNYFEVLDRIADTGRQVISYDQIGCGNSYLDGHPELWTQETWINELIALREYLHLDQLHLLGQSWGAMPASPRASSRSSSLRAMPPARCGPASSTASSNTCLQKTKKPSATPKPRENGTTPTTSTPTSIIMSVMSSAWTKTRQSVSVARNAPATKPTSTAGGLTNTNP